MNLPSTPTKFTLDSAKLALLFLILLSSLSLDSATEFTFSLPSSCPTSCGNISIIYPFGIGEGCFRSGLDLTCDYSTSPPKLFLGNGSIQVTNFVEGEVIVNATVVTLGVNDDFGNSSLIELGNKPFGFYFFEEQSTNAESGRGSSNYVLVFGCSAIAYLVDLDNNTRLGSCSTICPENNNDMQASNSNNNECNGIGCCYFDIPGNVSSFGVQLERINSTVMPLENSTIIKAFISNGYSLTLDDTEVTASLSWYINDQLSCEDAMKNKSSYACISSNSICNTILSHVTFAPKSGIGYVCTCSEGYQGNPYVPNGCLGPNITIAPKPHCEQNCGSIHIPYPFGLEEGCYREQAFELSCNRTTKPQILYFDNDLIVAKIFVEQGLIEFSNTSGLEATLDFLLFRDHFMLQDEGATVNWVIDYKSCDVAQQNMTTYACRSKNSLCSEENITNYESKNYLGYRCRCSDGYSGNPYLENGCTDINECKDPESHGCYDICTNTAGNFNCTCSPGTYGDPMRGPCIPNKKQMLLLGLLLGASVGIGLLLSILSVIILGRKWKRRKAEKMRDKFFHQNHGLLLQHLVSSTDDTTTNTKIFTLAELEKATNHFDDTRIIGHGGHGTVYKGILSDQRVVAIKRSKITIEREINQFINEVAILSQINHRNVVKLFGCCLETEVPLLVYEFISNGTLFHHLHNPDLNSSLTWDKRMRIATEAAGALTYLHSAAYISIFHRDVKSSNILLDECYTAKVSDFGASRSIPTDQSRITTAIQGTFGYLDPEYYQTGHLTDKSDVYSFGVILLELLTGRKPICPRKEGQEDMNLGMLFFQAMKDNRLYELVDSCIMMEDIKDEIGQVFELAKMCLNLKGDERPTMKAVEHKLQDIRQGKMKTKKWFGENCPETECLLDENFDASSYYTDVITKSGSIELQSMQLVDHAR